METQEEEKIDSTGNLEKVTRSIFILQRTRESLSSTFDATAYLERGGSLLDNALARQLSIRKAELDNLLPKNVSMIVRSLTPKSRSNM